EYLCLCGVGSQTRSVDDLSLARRADQRGSRCRQEKHWASCISTLGEQSRTVGQMEAIGHVAAELTDEQWIGQSGGQAHSGIERFSREAAAALSNTGEDGRRGSDDVDCYDSPVLPRSTEPGLEAFDQDSAVAHGRTSRASTGLGGRRRFIKKASEWIPR